MGILWRNSKRGRLEPCTCHGNARKERCSFDSLVFVSTKHAIFALHTAGNALGKARNGCFREYKKRVSHYETFEDPEFEPAEPNSRFHENHEYVNGTELQIYSFLCTYLFCYSTLSSVTECVRAVTISVDEKRSCTQVVLGAGVASQKYRPINFLQTMSSIAL